MAAYPQNICYLPILILGKFTVVVCPHAPVSTSELDNFGFVVFDNTPYSFDILWYIRCNVQILKYSHLYTLSYLQASSHRPSPSSQGFGPYSAFAHPHRPPLYCVRIRFPTKWKILAVLRSLSSQISSYNVKHHSFRYL